MTAKRVLIVDDNEDICVNFRDILDELGYDADMVTGYAQGDGAQRARDGGVLQVLRKPVDLGELLPLIKSVSHGVRTACSP